MVQFSMKFNMREKLEEFFVPIVIGWVCILFAWEFLDLKLVDVTDAVASTIKQIKHLNLVIKSDKIEGINYGEHEGLLYLAKNAECEQCDLKNVRLIGIDLSGVSFRGADLSNANLSGAVLNETSFIDAKLVSSNFQETTISHARFDRVRLYSADFSGAAIDNTDF